ncbi:MAG: SusC/RagA family TonB-linked outer membrane protein, partial [Bacteroidetes bacterium]|nr:SusC/RagA family TonB-linked outer membrane protein [Bacteroidota bacterium]
YQIYETKAGSGTLSVSLVNLGTDLNEVVVVGYGSQKKANLTSSVATIDIKKVEDIPVSSLTEALKGQVPGLNVSGGSQRPGDNATLSIRQQFGFSKDGSSPLPLIVIDDVIQIDPSSGLASMDQFNSLDPSQVESITVLRDGAAAIYGARGSQGAIIVKTKRGHAGAPKITYSGKFEYNNAVSFEKVMNAYDYGIFANRFGRASGWGTTNFFDDAELQSMKSLNYDWLKEAWKPGGAMQHALTVSGGSDRATYFAGASYYTQYPNLGKQDYNKWSFRSGVDVKVANNLKLSATVAAYDSKVEKSFTKISINDGAYTSGAEQTDYAVLLHMPKYIPWQATVNGTNYYTSPALGPLKNQNNPAGQNNISGWNYFGLLDNGSFTKDDNQSYVTNFSLQYDVPFIKGLSLKATYGLNYTSYNNEQAMLGLNLAAAQNTNQVGFHLYTDSSNWNVALNNSRSTVRYDDVLGKVQQGNFFVNYDNRFGKHTISAMASVEKGLQNFEKKFIIYDVPIYGAYNGSSPSAGTLNTSNTYVYKTDMGSLAYLGRINYDYDSKYLLQFIFRSDASTKFAPAKYWGFFPGVSAGWVVSREDWFSDKFKSINYLKIRASIGHTGKDNVKPWRWMQTFSYAADKGFGFGSNGGVLGNSLTPDATPNVDITWDNTIKKNIGIDMTLMNNRLSLSYDRYWDRNYGLLMTLAGTVGVPISVGGGYAEQNYGGVNDWGSELSVNWKDNVKKFGYSIGLNFGTSSGKYTKWIPVAFDYPGNITQAEGYSIIQPKWGFLTWKGTSGGDGLLRTDADINNYWQYLTDLATKAGTTPAYLGITTISGLKKGMLAYQDLAGNLDATNKTIAGPNGQIVDKQDYAKLVNKNRSYGFVLNIGLTWKDLSLNTQIATSWGGYNSIDYIKQPTSSGQMFWSKESYLTDMYDTLDNVNGKWPNVGYYSYNSYSSDFWKISNFRSYVRTLVIGYTLPKRISNKLKMDGLRVSLAGNNLWDFYNPYPGKYRNMYDDPKAAYPTLRTWAFGINATF